MLFIVIGGIVVLIGALILSIAAKVDENSARARRRQIDCGDYNCSTPIICASHGCQKSRTRTKPIEGGNVVQDCFVSPSGEWSEEDKQRYREWRDRMPKGHFCKSEPEPWKPNKFGAR